jgi:hypothetical protein
MASFEGAFPPGAPGVLNTVGNGTLTAALLNSGYLKRGGSQGGAAFTDTTDSAINIASAFPNAQAGQSFYVDIANLTNAQMSLAAGAGVTLSGVTAVGQNCLGKFLVTLVSITYGGPPPGSASIIIAAAVTVEGVSIVDRGIDNFNAASDPGVTNDNTQGFGVGSIWFNTSVGALRWWENRSAATGAAAWVFSGADYVNGGTNPSGEVTQFGSGTAVAAAEGNINRQCPGVAGGVAPGATGQDNVVLVYSIPASSFDQALRAISLQAWVQFAVNANTKRAKLWFNPTTAVVGSAITGGTLIADTGAVVQSGGSALLSGFVFKRGAPNANTQTVLPEGVALAGTHAGLSASAVDTVAVENAAILVALTINNTTAIGDCIGVALQVNAMN